MTQHRTKDCILNRVNSNNNNLVFDSIQIDNLQGMLENDSTNLFLPTVLARNAIVNANLLDYKEPLIFDSELKSASKRKVYPKIHIPAATDVYFKVHPNPACDYLIVECKLPENCPRSILKISSVDGKLHKQIALNSKRNEVVLPIEGLPSQIIISLFSDGKSFGNKKVVISK